MSSLHRVYSQSHATAEDGVVCPRCQHRNHAGTERCEACWEELFRHARARLRTVGEFSKRVTRGEDMPEVTRCLRSHGYPIGASPETVWRRRRRQEAREARRRRRGREDERRQRAEVVGG
jgi:hypothetical protein